MEQNISHRYRGRLFVNSEEYGNLRKKLESGFISNDNYLSFLSASKFDSNFLDNLIAISASAIMADGEHQEIEKKMIEELCNEFKFNFNEFNSRLEKEIASIESSDYSAVVNYLKSTLKVDESNNNSLLFETAMHIILSDGIMTMTECSLLADLGEILRIPVSQILARLGLFLRKEEAILVDVEEEINWRSISGITE
jgi:uncharacterized tellurite resistance protein B-like protein